jgi:ferredoxin-NADP reductase/nitrite reductase/ring-hydroxylating ferredoxin subunit
MGKDGYQKVANKKDLQEGSLLKVEPEGKPIVLSLVNGKVYAMDAVCSHEGGPLEEGTLEGYNLTCPWHYAIFDVRNAKVSDQTVWATDLNSYAAQVEEATGDILISLDNSVAESSEQQQQKPSTIIQRQQNEQQDVEMTKADSSKEKRRKLNEFELSLLEKQKYNETDVMSFKFSKQDIEQKKELDYISGQYAFFDIGGVYNDPEGPLRHFTIASSPTENFIMISTRIRDTPYKKRLSSLEEEKAKVKVRGPMGKFILHEDYSKPAVLLSGGIGVTPFRSMIKYATDKQLPIKIVMFDSNRDEANILYKNEFDECLKTNKNLKIICTITGEGQPPLGHWEGEAGRIDKTMITKYVSEDELNKSIFYICGPPAMLNALQNILNEKLKISKDRVKIEEFTGY